MIDENKLPSSMGLCTIERIFFFAIFTTYLIYGRLISNRICVWHTTGGREEWEEQTAINKIYLIMSIINVIVAINSRFVGLNNDRSSKFRSTIIIIIIYNHRHHQSTSFALNFLFSFSRPCYF